MMEGKYSYTPCSDWQIDVDGFPWFVELARQLKSHEPASRPSLPLPIDFDAFFGHQKAEGSTIDCFLGKEKGLP